ncbi:carbohydrate ABC transporter permease [Desertivibrio insolitus]|uniref:carbohydrate ABC transporter permease n=1 Tax=Herbiconiux sp. SYSU D00978 TaxID=2812562 RepID=UPI001A95681E|nr:sugar ABC transporter permease [Herbiconiux sp. SYSU D00978]
MTSTISRPAAPARQPEERKPSRGRSDLTFRQRLGRFDVKASPYLYISPFFITFAVIGLFPLVYTLWVSLHEWQLLQGQGAFVGFDNFTAVLQDRFFWNSIFNTFSIFLLSSVPQIAVALLIAAVLDQNLKAKTFWRMSVLLPYVVAPVAVALIFSSMFGEQDGLVNNLLGLIGIDPIQWKHDTLASHVAIATMVNWRWTGYNALILLAAMQAIPRDLYESAAIDGAGSTRRFFSITIPSIRPTLIFVIITATIGGLQIFAEPRLFDAASAGGLGGADRQFQTTVLYLWEMAFFRQNFGEAAAIAWLLFILIVAFGLINFLLSRRIASGEARAIKRRSGKRLEAHRVSQGLVGEAAGVDGQEKS